MSVDSTIEKNYLKGMKNKIEDYELVKQKKHPLFKTVTEFCDAHKTNRQTFLRYYNRYKQTQSDDDLLPQKRGPKWKTRRTDVNVENKVIELRKKGLNRYEIHYIIKEELNEFSPSSSCIYNITKRFGLNKLKKQQKKERRMIIKEKAGELGHIDCKYMDRNIIANENTRYFLVAVVDSCTRIAWAEVVPDIKSITVMFSVLRCFNMLSSRYKIQFEEVLTDNGAEFGSGKNTKNKMEHPFERMLIEMDIKHHYTRPYRPQTNGKVERFWKTLNFDMLEDTEFDSLEHLKDELLQYLIYYNEHRPHQSLNGKTPAEFLKNL